jgi:hypothetical protein
MHTAAHVPSQHENDSTKHLPLSYAGALAKVRSDAGG